MSQPSSRVVRLLLVLTTLGLGGTVVCGLGWALSAGSKPALLESLGPEERRLLVAEALESSPGIYEPASFEMNVGYTLKRGTEITAWEDTFVSNDVGYRAGPSTKTPGTFRIVFVGDSWTYGMGVGREEAFPHRIERLAREHSGSAAPIEAWSLALPGYNTMNELAALRFFFDRLQPDAVVLCPVMNDVDSDLVVQPNGYLSRAGLRLDSYGEAFPVRLTHQLVDSYRFRSRWGASFAAIRETEERLRARDVPLLLYFAGTWKEAFAHRLVLDAGIEAPYVIFPARLTGQQWRNPLPVGHPSPAAHDLYARTLYSALAGILGWNELPAGEEREPQPVQRRSEQSEDWLAASDALLTTRTREEIATRFTPGSSKKKQCTGRMNCFTGEIAQDAAILVRRKPQAQRLLISVRRVAEASFLYPMQLSVSIPSPSGGIREGTVVPADGSPSHRFEVAMPPDVDVGAALDVTFHLPGATGLSENMRAASLVIEAIEQE